MTPDDATGHVARRIELPPRRPRWETWSWVALAAAALAGYLLAVVYGEGSLGQRLIDALGLFPGFPGYEERSWQYTLARHLVALVAILVTARVVLALLGDRVAELRARFRRGHAVVCGLGETGLRSTRALRAAGYRVTCLERERGTEAVADARARGALVLHRDATQVSALDDARAARAAVVLCACPDDATNAAIASLVVALAHESVGPGPTVHVRLESPDLARHLRAPLASAGAARLHFFDPASVWARALLAQGEDVLTRDAPHVAVVGDTSLGRAVVAGAARRRHRHARTGGESGRATISLVAPTAADACTALVERHPALPRVCDLVPVSAPAMLWTGDALPDVVFACLEGPSANLAVALEASSALPPTPVFLPAEGAARALGPLLHGAGRINAIILPEGAGALDLLHDQMRDALARQVHEAHLAERRRRPDFGARAADREWADLDPETRRSNYAQVDALVEQLEAVWYDLEPREDWDEPLAELPEEAVEAMAELEHARWRRERIAAGWEYAPVRDDSRKRHDILVDWAELPEDVREANRAIVRGRPALIADAGYRLVRAPVREHLAQLLHARYAGTRAADAGDAPRAVPWEELDEPARAHNRSAVDDIAVKLARIGCRAVPSAVASGGAAFTPEEEERLAVAEHERWVAERVAQGWTRGPRDDARGTHPSLVPWEELSEAERDKDREVVHAIPELLAEAGYVVVRG